MADAEGRSRRVVFVVPAGRDGGLPVAGILGDVLAAGWDAHLLYEGADASEIPGLDALPDDVLRRRVHPPPRRLRHGPRPGLRRGLAHSLRRNPVAGVRQLGPRVPSLHRYLRAVMLAVRPDVVHVLAASSVDAWAGAAALSRARLVVSPRDEELALGTAERDRWSRLWQRVDGVVVETGALADLARDLGAPDRLAVVSTAPDPPPADWSLPLRTPGRPLRVLSVGPLSWTQGLEHSMRAVRLLIDQNVACEYRIVGTGEFADALGFARHQLGLEEVVDLVAPTTDGNGDHWRWADVLVNAAVVPVSPRTTSSALAHGVPVVTTEPSHEAAHAVLAVPRRDPEAIAAQLAVLARNGDAWTRLAHAGRAWASGGGRNGHVDELLGLYRTLL